eukprot:148851_1
MSFVLFCVYLLLSVSAKYVINDNTNYQRLLSPSNTIGLIDILDEIHVEFNLLIHSFQSSLSTYSSILQFGNTQNEKYPAIFINDTSEILYIQFNSVSNTNQAWQYPITTNTLYNIQFHATQTNILFIANNVVLFNESITSHSILFDRNIYLSNPWHNSSNCTLTGLIITTNNSIENPFNYLCDYNNRFTDYTGNWTYDPNTCYVTQNDYTIAIARTWMGDKDPTSLLWKDYSIEMHFMVTYECPGTICFGLPDAKIVFRQTSIGTERFIYVETSNTGNALGFILSQNDTKISYQSSIIDVDGNNQAFTNQLYILRVDAYGDTFDIYINDQFQITHTDNRQPFGSIGLGTFTSTTQFQGLYITFPNDGEFYSQSPSTSPTTDPTLEPTPGSMSPTTYPTLAPTGTMAYGLTVSLSFNYTTNITSVEDIRSILEILIMDVIDNSMEY